MVIDHNINVVAMSVNIRVNTSLLLVDVDVTERSDWVVKKHLFQVKITQSHLNFCSDIYSLNMVQNFEMLCLLNPSIILFSLLLFYSFM